MLIAYSILANINERIAGEEKTRTNDDELERFNVIRSMFGRGIRNIL